MVRRTWGLDARITVYDATKPTGGDWLFKNAPFSRAYPVGLWQATAFLDEARAKGTPVTFRATGGDAERAIRIVQEVLVAPVGELSEEFVDVF